MGVPDPALTPPAPEPPAVWWSPTWRAVIEQFPDGQYEVLGEPAVPLANLPADAVRLVREEDVDDLRLRLWQEHDAARAAGIPRGSIVAAQSVVGNILMNAPESMSLQEIAVAIVDEVAGALAVLPGDAGAVPDTGQARADRLADGIRKFADDCKLLLDFGGLDNRVARSIAQQERNLRALLAEPSGHTVQAPDVAALLRRLDELAERWELPLTKRTEDVALAYCTAARDLRRALLGTDTTPDRLARISEAGETAAVERQARYQETACALSSAATSGDPAQPDLAYARSEVDKWLADNDPYCILPTRTEHIPALLARLDELEGTR